MAVTTSGKDKLLKWMRVYIHAYDLSGDTRTFAALSNGYDVASMLGVNQSVNWFMASSGRILGLRGYQALLNDATGGAFTRLKQTAGSPTTTRLSAAFVCGGEPAVGDPAYVMNSIQIDDRASFDAAKGILTADFLVDRAQYSVSAVNPLGVVLSEATALSATTNKSSFDYGASSSNGAHANIHIISAGGSWVFKVQHSTNDADWSDLITFVVTGSALNSETGLATGTINRYVRFQATRTSGTCTPVCFFARN